jgi:hypothetical protein
MHLEDGGKRWQSQVAVAFDVHTHDTWSMAGKQTWVCEPTSTGQIIEAGLQGSDATAAA